MNQHSEHDIVADLVYEYVADGKFSESELRESASDESPEVRSQINSYIQSVRPVIAAMEVCTLDSNTGGLCDGSEIYINSSVLYINGTVQQTAAQMHEVLAHEQYHLDNGHLEAMSTFGDDTSFVVMGGEDFSRTAFIEGLTVAQTGDQFVSATYVEYKNRLLHCIGEAGFTLDDVEKAVKKRDVTPLDDRSQHAPEPIANNYSVAV